MTKSDVKRLAATLEKEGKYPDLTYCQLLNKIVVDLGYKSWNHYCAENKD